MKTTLVIIIGLLGSLSLFSQEIEYFDANWEPTTKNQATYYREITYDENGAPIGLVKDFYITGEIQFEGYFLSLNPEVMDGTCTWYYKNGQKSQEVIYQEGAIIEGPRNWSVSGKEEGVLDDSGYFYSEVYKNDLLSDLSKSLSQKLVADTLTICLLLKLGITLLKRGDFDVGEIIFRLAHDVSVSINDKVDQATSYNNIGGIYETQGNLEQALVWYEKARVIREMLDLQVDLAASYNNIGTVHKSQGNLEQALSWFEKAIEIRRRLNLEEDLATSYNNIGVVHHTQGNLKRALGWIEKAIEIRERLNLEEDLASSYSNLGFVYQTQGNLEQALSWFEKAIEIRKRLNLEIDLARSYNSIGFVYQTQGNLEQALRWHERAKEIRERLNLEVDLSRSYTNIGFVYHTQGNLEQALRYYEKAQKIQDRLNLDVDLASTYNNIGAVYSSQGKFEQALMLYENAQEIQERLNLEVNLARSYSNIGGIYDTQGDLEQALRWYERAQKIQERLNLEVDLARTYNNIGRVFNTQEILDQALIWCKKAQEIQERLNLEIDLANTYSSIGAIYYSKGNLKQAQIQFDKAQEIQERFNLEVDLARSYNDKCVVYGTQGNLEEALIISKKAQNIQQRLHLEVDLAKTYNNIAFNHFYLSQLDSALIYAQKNIQLNEKIRTFSKLNANRQLYVDRSLDAAEIGTVSSYLLDKLQMSYSFSEKNKTRSLQDLLIEKYIKAPKLSEELLSRIIANNSQLNAINQELSKNIPEEKRENFVAFRDSLYKVRTKLDGQVKLDAPEYSNLVYPETITSEEIQSILSKEEVLVSYFTGQINTFAFIQTPTELQVLDLGPSHTLSLLIDQFRSDFIPQQKAIITSKTPNRLRQNKLNQQFFQLSTQLYQKLWAPIDSTGLLKDKKIILVPDGFLNYLPFELLVKDTVKKDFQDYHYLIKDHPISYYPSATVLHFERTKAGKGAKPNKDYFGLAVSNFDNALCTEDGTPLNNLSNTTSSVESIQNYFSPAKSTTLFNHDANSDQFSSLDLKDYRYLHFATHGQINSEKPEFSTILLHDACLNLYEIFELEFNADLVTLSACETGLGKLVRGEGMVGFTRALMYAGTPSVILSLWEVGDDSTKDLFVNYYSKLAKDGSEKYAPLRAAQLDMINSGKYSNPYYWAPFVFIGERGSKF